MEFIKDHFNIIKLFFETFLFIKMILQQLLQPLITISKMSLEAFWQNVFKNSIILQQETEEQFNNINSKLFMRNNLQKT